MSNYGHHIRQRREELNLSRVAAETKSGVGRSTWVRLESGEPSKASTKRKVAAVLNWSDDSFHLMDQGHDPHVIEGTPASGSYAELVAHVASLETAIERLAALIEQHIAAPQ